MIKVHKSARLYNNSVRMLGFLSSYLRFVKRENGIGSERSPAFLVSRRARFKGVKDTHASTS